MHYRGKVPQGYFSVKLTWTLVCPFPHLGDTFPVLLPVCLSVLIMFVQLLPFPYMATGSDLTVLYALKLRHSTVHYTVQYNIYSTGTLTYHSTIHSNYDTVH